MNTIIKTIILFLVSIFSAYAQNNISGQVLDTNNKPLEFANVILHEANSKDVVTGVISGDSGFYKFEAVENGIYYLQVSVLGFKTKTSDVFELENTLKTFNFLLEEDVLDEILITHKRPVIKQTAEKLIIDLEQSEMINSNLQDVMRGVPGIIVTNNGISYAGQSNIRILINGKTTDYMDMDTLLRDMPADNIAKVELIEQPGAEFEAVGSGPIINIILKKNVKLGTHGSIATWAGEDEGFEHGTSASIASYKNKLNWQASTGYSSPTWREDLFINRTVGDETYNQATIEPYNPRSFRVSGSIDYYINDKHSVGFGVRNSNTNSDRVANSANIITSTSTTDYLYSENSFNRDQKVFNINPYYEFKNDAHKLTADFNYVDYKNDNINTLVSVNGSTIEYANQRYLQDGNYQIKTYKSDYVRSFSEDFKLSAGAKYSQVNTNSDLQSFNENESGDFDFNSAASNTFLVDENIFALYSKINITRGKWSFSGGLRFEDSNTKGTSSSDNETRERKISKLFPSAALTRKINKNLAASLAYSYRISRPNYNTLNSFVTFYDPLSSEVGNENLKPSFTNKYQFNLTFDGQPFFTLAYSQTKDDMFQFVSQDNSTAQIERTTINLSDSKNWNFRLFGPLSFINKVEGYTGIIVSQNKFESSVNNLNLQKWNLVWFTQASYELPWEINAEVSGNYGTGALEGGLDADWFADLNLSLGKKFLDNKLKVNLAFSKLLNRGFVGVIDYNNLYAEVESNQSRQNIQLRLSYSFGSKFGKKSRRKNASQDEENRINDNN